jgi:dipeptidyl aminopeptidase/acylaminoacyl peptidase
MTPWLRLRHCLHRIGRGLIAATLIGGPIWIQPTFASAPAPPVEQFVGSAGIAQVTVSPSGEHAAFIGVNPAGRRVLVVMGLARSAEARVLAAIANADITRVWWVNDDRLVFEAFESDTLVREGGAGTFAVDREGRDLRQLIAWQFRTGAETGTRIDRRILPFGWFVYGTLDDGSEDILVVRRGFDGQGDATSSQLARLNTRTARLRTLGAGTPPYAVNWLLDRDGELRLVRTSRDGREAVHWLAPGSQEWVQVSQSDWYGAGGLTPLLLEGENELIVYAAHQRDTGALYSYRLDQRRIDPEPILAIDGFDLEPTLVRDSRSHRLLGARTRAAAPLTVWFDERLATIQQELDKALPGRSNRIQCGRCETAQHFVVVSGSDRHPGEVLHYDHARKTIRRLGSVRGAVEETGQGTRSFHRFAARDGLSIPIVVTHPAGSTQGQPLPAVVLVHGGPWTRGADTLWSAEAQFLASRGYRVLEVEFRGSTGFGWQHFHAGWKQWGLAMQDDLADAVAWAAGEKLVDPARVCLYGASYGGYAALMGPIRHPQTYRCAASYVGVTDIELMYTSWRSDLGNQFRNWGMPTLIGDRQADAAQLRQASPLLRAREIRVPLLLAQGVWDRRVPREHFDRFVSAARAAGVEVESRTYDEAHGWNHPANHADFLRRLEAFLARSLKADTP